MKNIWIVTTGSRGDVQPYIAVALALQKHGYQAVLGETIEENSFLRGMATGNVNELTEGIKLLNQKSAPYTCKVIRQQEEDPEENLPDLCIANILSLGVAWYLALKYDIPFYELGCSDNTFNPDYASGGLPTPPFKLHYLFMRYLIPIFKADLNMPIVKALDPGLAAQLKRAPLENTLDPVLARGVMLSPEIAAVLHPKASPKIEFLGSTMVESQNMTHLEAFRGGRIYQDVKNFVEAGSKPIYVGWGSMMCHSPEYMVELCIRAIYRAGQRAIVLGGMANLSYEALENTAIEAGILNYAKANVLFVPQAPHEWLFTQVCLTVHHGGAGTTTAAMHAGIPTIISPLITDQFDYAYAVNKLGNGIGLPQLHKVTWQELGDAILQAVQDKGMKERAAQLAKKIRMENGAENAVKAIEIYWNEVGETKGKFRDVWPNSKPASSWCTIS